MNSETPQIDSFEDGYNAAIDGLHETDNPYPIGSADHATWREGFLAFEEDDPDA